MAKTGFPLPPGRGMPRLRHVLAPNPSPLTFTGTNTYLLGSGRVALIDPGPDDPAHMARILDSLDPGETVSHIFVTHPHRDHSALAPALSAATGAPTLGFGTATEGRSPRMAALAETGMTSSGDGLDHGFRPDLRLADGDRTFGDDWEITTLHTPGHLGSHICLSVGEWLFSGDHVMGWSSSVVSPPDGDMSAYLSSLLRLDHPDWSHFLPGHGDPVAQPRERVQALYRHRVARGDQILAALSQGPASCDGLRQRIYPDIPPSLRRAAHQTILAHLIDLLEQNRISSREEDITTARFSLAR
ncbi:MAG: MBL fold metallo-hydrolase [Paracoccaceae bacterium]